PANPPRGAAGDRAGRLRLPGSLPAAVERTLLWTLLGHTHHRRPSAPGSHSLADLAGLARAIRRPHAGYGGLDARRATHLLPGGQDTLRRQWHPAQRRKLDPGDRHLRWHWQRGWQWPGRRRPGHAGKPPGPHSPRGWAGWEPLHRG